MIFNSFKGWFGESIINLSMWLFLDDNIYHTLNNVIIETRNGTTQIDHIIVSKYGIFVVETKNFSGWIFGDKNSKVWTQCLYGKKYKFQNPLHQNYKHIKSLQELLNLKEKCFYSIVMFIGESSFKTKMPENVLDEGYTAYIQSKNHIFFSEKEVIQLVDKIKLGKLSNSFATQKQHKKSLNDRYNNNSNCPKCNGFLIERTSTKGKYAGNKFFGCSNFPKCRYIKNFS